MKTHTGLPRHVAIIMDGNGRWAEQRQLPRIAGHKAGVDAVRAVIKAAAAKGVEVLTLFAFSSENWRRPQQEVGFLMDLLLTSLQQEASRLNENNIRVRFIGDRSAFPAKLNQCIEDTQKLTEANRGLTLVVAANYGGRWDMIQAMRELARLAAAGRISPDDITDEMLGSYLSLHDVPEPDLFIRTGGDQRISNFLLWQLAYTELYFTECLWPDFSPTHLEAAIESYSMRQRRFGRTGEQIRQAQGA
jgi:undecaprenyl diphosphate synthase